MKSLLLSLAVLLLASCQLSEADIKCNTQTGCKCVTSDFTIDISNAFDYPVNTSYTENKKTYVYTFTCSPSNCGADSNQAAVCQFDPDQTASTNCGKAGEVEWTVNSQYNFSVEYLKGTPTTGESPRERSSTIKFVVVNDTKTPRKFDFTSEDDSDSKKINYIFSAIIQSHRVSKGGVAAGVIGIVLIVLVLVAIAAYFIIGTIVMYTAKGARGTEMIPNYLFWKGLPGLIKDGCCLTIAPCKYLYEKKTSGGGYQTL